MGYAIKKVPWKKGPGWKLQYISYANADIGGKKSKRKIQDVDKNDWSTHGFSADMTLEQAKAKSKALNAQKEINRWNETKPNSELEIVWTKKSWWSAPTCQDRLLLSLKLRFSLRRCVPE